MAKRRAKKATSTSAAKKITESLPNEAPTVNVANAVLVKVCRLCETKDGPFLGIFDAEQIISKRIEELMPFAIAENDDLPDKICFRCSAKVEELHEFIQKCVRTQNNLHSSMGKKSVLFNNTTERVLWEEILNKYAVSNDTICEDLIKSAMEDTEYVPLKPKILEDQVKQLAKRNNTKLSKLDAINIEHKIESNSENEIVLKNLKLSLEKVDQKVPLESNKLDKLQDNKLKSLNKSKSETHCESKTNDSKKETDDEKSLHEDENKINDVNSSSGPPNKQEVPFNIMDHVIKIKVNGVGTLFQCQLCNKNFLKIEVVESHGCAKNGAPKLDFARHIPPPQPPKMPSIKYIKIDGNLKKNKDSIVDKSPKVVEPKKTEKVELKLPQPNPNPPHKPKPKIGPASRVKKQPSETVTGESQALNTLNSQMMQTKQPVTNITVNQAAPVFPVMTFPVMPKVNSRYSFVPGPNNTFTLVEEQNSVAAPANETPTSIIPTSSIATPSFPYSSIPNPSIPFYSNPTTSTPYPNISNSTNPVSTISYPSIPTLIIPSPSIPTPSNITNVVKKPTSKPVGKKYAPGPKSKKRPRTPSPEIIELDDEQTPDQPSIQPNHPPNLSLSQPSNQPYPVSLFKIANPDPYIPPQVNQPSAFATPAMKKQLYTVVQTGNPSKLLISSKPLQTVDDPPKKRARKSKLEVKESYQQLNATVDNTKPAKDSDNFTFINVNPFVEPKYVLPTDSIQESQISTSSQVLNAAEKKDKDSSGKLYSCNMCSERFSREKKLLSHIHSHYTKMDEEDQLREKTKKKKMKI